MDQRSKNNACMLVFHYAHFGRLFLNRHAHVGKVREENKSVSIKHPKHEPTVFCQNQLSFEEAMVNSTGRGRKIKEAKGSPKSSGACPVKIDVMIDPFFGLKNLTPARRSQH